MEFENVKELVQLTPRNKIKQINLFSINNNKKSKIDQLYQNILCGKISSDEEGIEMFFPQNPLGSAYFERLKKKLRDRLYNTLFFIDLNESSTNDTLKAYKSCYRSLAIFKILVGSQKRHLGLELANEALEVSLELGFCDISMQIARELTLYYGSVDGNVKKYKHYKTILNDQFENYHAELKAESFYNDLVINFTKSRSKIIKLGSVAKAYIDELETLKKEINSYRFNLFYFNIYYYYYEIINDRDKILDICHTAVDFFKNKEHSSFKNAVWYFQARIISQCIYKKEFTIGLKACEECYLLVPKGTYNYYLTYYYNIILYYYCNRLAEAFELTQVSKNEHNFSSLPISRKECWNIFDAYNYYFVRKNKILPPSGSVEKNFRVSKFLNEVPTYSKDKQGVNVTIIVLQILILLEQGQVSTIIDKSESFNEYIRRHLKGEENFRSRTFLKILLLLSPCHFNLTAFKRRASPLMDQLRDMPVSSISHNIEVEIVPYETLWEMVLESLEKLNKR